MNYANWYFARDIEEMRSPEMLTEIANHLKVLP